MLCLPPNLHRSKAMMAVSISILAFATALAGCQTAIAPVQVTRFHTIAPGSKADAGSFQISSPANTLDEATYQEAVIRELQRLGYSAAPVGGPSAFTVSISTKRDIAAAGAARSPVTVGVGGGTGGYGSGIGIGLGFNLGGKPKDVVITNLSVSIQRMGVAKPIWEGRAEYRAKSGTPGAQPGLAAAKLAASLFANYPGESGKTVIVP